MYSCKWRAWSRIRSDGLEPKRSPGAESKDSEVRDVPDGGGSQLPNRKLSGALSMELDRSRTREDGR